jgi:phage repressor protein C with HTH and peptisase S24 domain
MPSPQYQEEHMPKAEQFKIINEGVFDDAYEITIADRSMEPRYRPGYIAHVTPRLPPKEGCDVYFKIATAGGSAPKTYVKTLVSIDDQDLRVSQLAPKRTLTFPRKDVVLVHAVIGAGPAW